MFIATNGAEIKKLRKMRGITQDQLAEVLGITSQGLSLIERGKRNLSLEKMKVLMDYFDVPIQDLFVPGVIPIEEKIEEERRREQSYARHSAKIEEILKSKSDDEYLFDAVPQSPPLRSSRRFDALDAAMRMRDNPALRKLFFAAIDADEEALQLATDMLVAFNRRKPVQSPDTTQDTQ